MKGFPDLPPIWWLGSIGLIYLGRVMAPGVHWDTWLFDLLSWVLMIGALALIFWAAYWFFKKKTPIEPHHDPKVLVVEGPYRLSRNPIYAALVALTLASALGHGSVLGLLLAAGLAWVLHHRFVLPEEAGLRAAFGAEADSFIAKTRRWL